MGSTDHYGLKRLGAGESFSADGYKFTDADRALIDRLIYLGAEGHRHGLAAPAAPSMPTMALTQSALSGALPAGSRIYFKFTLVDVNGFEGGASPEQFVDTPAPVVEPGAPTLVPSSTGGSLLPGQYFYVLSAWPTVSTAETKALNPSYITVPVGTSTNKVTLTLPTYPAGAAGLNIFRKKPGDSRYQFLAATTSTTTYVDNGSVAEDCNRTIPSRNSTNSSNSVTANIGTVPVGYTWKLYRTLLVGSYENALVHHVVEQTSEGSGIVRPNYTDMGLATLVGSPPTTSQVIGGPSAINLQDAAEVTGALPLASVSAFPQVVEFEFAGAQSAGTGTEVWVCEFPRASIQGVRAALGRGYTPAAQSLIVDVNVGRGSVPAMASLFAASGDQPRVLVGEQIGARVVPTARTELVLGDVLTIDRDQVGGGATPTDRDLKVLLYLLVYGYTSSVSFTRPTSPFAPAQIPNIFAWYKASSLGLADSTPVSSWTDLSGQGNHALSSGTNRPLLRTAVLNGKAVVRFDGVDDYLQTAAMLGLPTGLTDQPITVVQVVKSASVAATHEYFDGTGGDFFMVQTNAPAYSMGSAAGNVVSNVPATTAFRIIACTFHGTTSKIWVGGGVGVIGDAGFPTPTKLTLGAHGALSGNFLDGDMAEWIAFYGEPDMLDLNALCGSLATEYAGTWTTAS